MNKLSTRLYVFCSLNFKDDHISSRIGTHKYDTRTVGQFLDEIDHSKRIFKEQHFGIGKERVEQFSKALKKNNIILR